MTAFYSVRQIAGTLGISEDTVRRAITRGTLSVHRFGRCIRIAADDLERWFATTKRNSSPARPAQVSRVATHDYARLLRDRVRNEVGR